MANFGIICNDGIDTVGHSLFLNFRKALINHLKVIFKDVKNHNDLNGLDYLIIVDEHYAPNVNIWKHDIFINIANEKSIKVLVFNFEKIHSAQFPWNIDHQNKLQTFKFLQQLVSDIDDAKILKKDIINKQFLSKDTELVKPGVKKDKVLFIGQVNNYYPTRRNTISQFNALGIPFDIIITERKYTYKEYLDKLNEYKYIFNPLGTGKFINLRFYETLKIGSIPIQQLTEDMIPWYSELNKCFSFVQVDKVSLHQLNKTQYNTENYYLEDYFDNIKLKDLFQ